MRSVTVDHAKDPIAIIGIGCRYPGAGNVEELWQNLLAGKDSIGPYPGGRFPGVDRAYASAGKPGGLLTNEGGFLQEIDTFDSQFFELSPRETVYVDPQHRLLLEVGWDALEDAGLVRADYEGSRTSVFVGLWTSEYETRLYESGSEPDFYSVTGCGRASASGRVSYAFGLEGPSVTVDSACSSSLVAVQMACESLWQGESEMALAGGANLILGREITELFTRAGMLAPDGRCKFGDVRANGFVRSEGAGMVVLKRLSRARADGDRIYALIRGGAINNDGRTSGLLVTPSRPGQRQMLETAWQAAGIDLSRLRYLEAHGTGTAIGDPVELGAITDALTAAGVRERCALGSIKSNIGHTEAAAGVAGLIKAALVLQHRVIPPSLHCETPNPKIAWDEAPIRLAREAIDLRDEPGALLAGVSAFGITGTNAHVVLEEAEPQTESKPEAERARVLPISAQSPQALQGLLSGYRRQVEAGSESLEDICTTAALRRNHHEFRTALVGSNRAELMEGLEAAVHGEAADRVVTGRAAASAPRVVFVAPGQGSQWPGMARELYAQEPAFRAAFDACDQAIARETGWSLRERLLGDRAEEFLTQIDAIQPALFAMSVALAAVWRAWGVEPDVVVGHSMGEVAAAHLAGVLSLEDAAAVICRRSRLMKTLRTDAAVVGGMATVDLSLKETEALLAARLGLSVAASNGPSTTVISGDLPALEELLHELEVREVYCRLVKVDVASHSPQVDPILDRLHEELAEIEPRAAQIPMLSTVTGGYAETAEASGTRLDARYWVRNLRQCVLLAPAVRHLAEEGHSVFLELSPHPILLPSIESSARQVNGQVAAIASLRREKPARATMLMGLAALYTSGYPVRWERLFPDGGRCVRLPQYPFQRERCWPEPAQTKRWNEEEARHPLLGMRFTSSRQPQTVIWESRIGIGAVPYLTDHRVLRSAVFPAAAYVDMALSAVRALQPEGKFALVDAAFRNAAYLPEEGSRIFQLAMTPEGAEAFTFEVRSRAEEDGDPWTLHATGKLQLLSEEKKLAVSVTDLEAMCPEVRDGETHYRQMAQSGLQYGPAFRLVEEVRIGEGRSVCRLAPVREEQGSSVLHPALLDACFQSMAHVRPGGEGFDAEDTYLPVSIERVQVYTDVPHRERLLVLAERSSCDAKAGSFRVNLRLLSEEGEVIADVAAMEAQRVARHDAGEARSSLYTLRWVAEAAVREPAGIPRLRQENWIVFADKCGVGDTLAEALTFGGGLCTLVRPGKDFAQTEEREYTIRLQVRADLDELLRAVARKSGTPTAVVHLWSLRGQLPQDADAMTVTQAQAVGSVHVPLIVQAVTAANWPSAPRLWMVTSGCMSLGVGECLPSVESAPLWGMGRTVAQEHPELRATLVDLSASPDAREARELARRIHENGDEDRMALRGQQSYVARLAVHSGEEVEARLLADDEAYRVEMNGAASLDGLRLRAFHARKPEPGEVAIEVVAAGLNFIDVARVMGIYPGLDPTEPLRLGMECAGRVTAVGAGVRDLQPGDEVLAITPSAREGLLASQVVLPAEAVLRKPAMLSFEQAATTPIAFLTAYYGLVELGRLRAGEWVLIHAGAGGVGLAAIEIARAAGARIIATVGSKEKEDFVRSRGVIHVFSSRSSEFAAAVMEATGGRGVDVVLNSLSGELIDRGLEVLAPYGRFVELGKRDIYEDRQVGLRVFRKNISFHVVDLADTVETQRQRVREWLEIVMEHVASGTWRPLPVRTFASQEPSEPFRFMAQARHIGKIAVAMERSVSVLPATGQKLFSAGAGYLITGGLGGIGLTVAEWMAREGAGWLVLMSRRAVSDEAASTIRRIEDLGCRVRVARSDVTCRADVDNALEMLRAEGIPLRGVLHAAALVDDVLIREMTPDRFAPVLAPKVEGTWNLHAATLEDKLDFFVLFSSMAAIHPQPGMGIYAAANAFLDGFAHYRRGLGLPATAVNWGGWDQIGLARVAGTERSLDGYREQGIRNFSASEALQALAEAIRSQSAQLMAMPIDWKTFAEFHGGHTAPLFREFVAKAAISEQRSSSSAIIGRLVEVASGEERREILEAWLQETLGRVLKLAARKVDPDRPMGTMGLDSLMGIEFVRRLSSALEIPVPATVVFNYPTIRLLARQLLQRLNLQEADASPVAESVTVAPAELPEISEEDALQALMSPEGSNAR